MDRTLRRNGMKALRLLLFDFMILEGGFDSRIRADVYLFELYSCNDGEWVEVVKWCNINREPVRYHD